MLDAVTLSEPLMLPAVTVLSVGWEEIVICGAIHDRKQTAMIDSLLQQIDEFAK